MQNGTKSWSTVWKVVSNKWFIATAIFLFVFLVFDENNFFVTARLQREVNELEKKRDELQMGIERDSIHALALQQDMNAIERYGREVYYMKRADEDIFIVTPLSNKEQRKAIRRKSSQGEVSAEAVGAAPSNR